MSRLPKPSRTFRSIVKATEEEQRRQRSTSPFKGSGLSIPSPGTTQVEGNLLVTGDFTANGKVNNDALTNPTSPQAIYNTASGFAMSTSFVTKVSQTITVPAGFTAAAITVSGSIFAYNQNPPGTGLDYLYAQAWIDTVHGAATPLACTDNGGSGKNTCGMSTVLTGLSGGGTFNVLISGETSFYAWPSHSSMLAEISGLITWYR